tara:strand:+ start:8943 stop:9914 length:972 start_codon:yes stop_codon:yes gene_type:complete
MAVKFSDFTNEAVDMDLTYIVGYKSGTNTQYTPQQLATGILAADSGFTLGSVIFTGESGVLSQDNSNFFWDNTLNRLGIGTTEPGASIETTEDIIVGDTKSIGRSSSAGPNIEFIDTAGEEDPQRINFRSAATDIAGFHGPRLGIGTTLPVTKLHVEDATQAQQMWGYDATSYTTLTVADDSHTTLATGESGDITLDAAGEVIIESNLKVTGQAYSEQHDGGAGMLGMDWNDGNNQYIQLTSDAPGLTNTFAASNPLDGATYILQIKQPSSGAAGTVTWGASVKWPGGAAPTLTATNDAIDIVTLVYNGTTTHYYATSILNLS